MKLKPGALEEIAHKIDARSDNDVAKFLGVTEDELEALRYGAPLTILKAATITARREAHLRAADLLDPDKTAA